MYNSLILPPTPTPLLTTAEKTYRSLPNSVRTKGTIFLLPPDQPTLLSAFNAPPRPKTRMSSGAVALCKHFERGGASEHGILHPYWRLPVGSNEDKTRIAAEVLERLLGEVVWRNVMLLHRGVAVYEVRNSGGWGMRWTLDVALHEDVEERKGGGKEDRDGDGKHVKEGDGTVEETELDVANKPWRIVKTTFRGFVEPIEGLDHELDGTSHK